MSECIIAYDADWQYPAITEKCAFNRLLELAPNVDSKVVYFGFPWATLIDLLNTGSTSAKPLLTTLYNYREQLKGKKIVTVCQHILLLKYAYLFEDLGISDVFWSHTTKSTNISEFKLYPFPLYPVQVSNNGSDEDFLLRKYIYSFVGARANQWYLTESRNWILDTLKESSGGLIIGRDQWHYNKVVYGGQIRGEDILNPVDDNASSEFKSVMSQSMFTLCPSGSGPNSIRLWESIKSGVIPVIISDTYLPPGNIKLWEDAVVFCDEDEKSVRGLADRLTELSKDSDFLLKKRNALKQICIIYSDDLFIYDVLKVMAGDCSVVSSKLVSDSWLLLARRRLSELTKKISFSGFSLKLLNDRFRLMLLIIWPKLPLLLRRVIKKVVSFY